MSANLLAEGDHRTGMDGTTYADGVWSIPANGTSKDKNAANDWPTGTEAVTENQTLHVGLSVRAANGASVVVVPGVACVDGAGNVNYVTTRVRARGTGAWQRVEGSFVMPSGMRVSFFFVHQGAGGAALELTAPCLSYGSPVCLASSAHTPYATQDHVSVTYATKSQLKVTDDSIKAEVTQRTKTDQMVSEVSSRLTQTADGFNASIDRLSDTDKKVNSWFDFEADASGNPQLKMGSSTSPVVGTYTNSGLAYKSRDGATIMELDASRSATISDHMETQDVKIGKWKWIQTQGGTHLTLVWAG